MIKTLAFLILSLSLQAVAEDSISSSVSAEGEMHCLALGCPGSPPDPNQGKRGSSESRELRKAARDEFKAAREAIHAKLEEARAKRKEAIAAAQALEGEEKKAAMKAARAAFRETVAALRAERKAAREKFLAAISNGDEAQAMAAANKADGALKENARKNEEVSQEILAAGEEAPAEQIAEASAPAVQERTPASQSEEKSNNGSSSRVIGQ